MRALIARDVRLAWRAGGGAMTGLLFFLAVVALVPFAVGPDLPLLARIGPAILWLGALLASLLGLDRLWTIDREDGSLDLLLGAPDGLTQLALAKILAHWLTTGLPLALAAPLLAPLAGLGPAPALGTALTLLIGTPGLAALGCAGAAVAVALPRGGLLIAVIVLPLSVPILIFGVGAAGAMRAGAGGIDWAGALPALALLAASSLIALAIAPFASAAALRGRDGQGRSPQGEGGRSHGVRNGPSVPILIFGVGAAGAMRAGAGGIDWAGALPALALLAASSLIALAIAPFASAAALRGRDGQGRSPQGEGGRSHGVRDRLKGRARAPIGWGAAGAIAGHAIGKGRARSDDAACGPCGAAGERRGATGRRYGAGGGRRGGRSRRA